MSKYRTNDTVSQSEDLTSGVAGLLLLGNHLQHVSTSCTFSMHGKTVIATSQYVTSDIGSM